MAIGVRFVEGTDSWIIQGDGGEAAFAHSRASLSIIATEACKELGWECGPSMQFNPSGLPTPAKLEEAIRNAHDTHPHIREPGFPALLTSFMVLQTYISWLPEAHRRHADSALRHIESRIEELVILRMGLRQFRQFRQFERRLASSHTAIQMMSLVEMIANQINEATGVSLW